MRRRRDLAIFGGGAARRRGGRCRSGSAAPTSTATAIALALAGPAAGAALSLAVGRPNLAIGAFAGVGAYVSGALAIRGLDVPLAVLIAIAGVRRRPAPCWRWSPRGSTSSGSSPRSLLVALGLLALTQALPHLSGGQAGLGPLPALGTCPARGPVAAAHPDG